MAAKAGIARYAQYIVYMQVRIFSTYQQRVCICKIAIRRTHTYDRYTQTAPPATGLAGPYL